MNDITPQYPWSDGDKLFASALNAAIANSAAYGPFLPLSGGTVSNPSINAPGILFTPIGMYAAAPPAPTAWRGNIESYVNVGTSGGHFSDATTNAIFGNLTVYGAPNNNCWGITSTVTYQGTGGTGQHTALTGYANRNTAVAQPTTTVAATLGAPSNVVQVADVTNLQVPYPMPVTINGNGYMQTAVSGASGPGTITLSTLVSVADGTAGRAVQGNNNPQIWGSNIYAVDLTGLDSQHTNTLLGMELDFAANGLDNAGPLLYGSPTGVRSGLVVVGLKGNPSGASAELANAIVITAGADTTYKRCITIGANTPFSQAAFDARGAVQQSGANAIWLASGHNIAFDSAGTVKLAELNGALTVAGTDDPFGVLAAAGHYARIKYQVGGQVWSAGCLPDASWRITNESAAQIVFSVSSNGNATFANSCAFFGASPPAKPTVTGSRAGNAALTSLLTALASYGLVTDSTTA